MTVRLADTPVLETERLILRAPVAEDYARWEPFAMSDRARYIGGPYTAATAWRGFGHAVGHWVLRGWGSFVFTRKGDDRGLGMTGPWFPRNWPERELGWTLWDDRLEGTGIAHEAAARARDYAFDVLGWDTAVSYIDAPNARSIALAERLGAVHDPDAPVMDLPDDSEARVLVYRHPHPGGAA